MPQQLDEDTIAIRFKRPRRDGATHILLAPAELIGRMAALVPRPFTNSIIYSGVLSARSAWRADVVPGRPAPTSDSPQGRPCPSRRTRIPWATLLKRVFGVDPTHCDCGGRYRLVATIRDPRTEGTGPPSVTFSHEVPPRRLRWLAMRAEPEPITPARPPPAPDLHHDEPDEAHQEE